MLFGNEFENNAIITNGWIKLKLLYIAAQ
jgi:hypothetical protein